MTNKTIKPSRLEKIKELNLHSGDLIELTVNTSISPKLKKLPDNHQIKSVGYFKEFYRMGGKYDGIYYTSSFALTGYLNPNHVEGIVRGCLLAQLEQIRAVDKKITINF